MPVLVEGEAGTSAGRGAPSNITLAHIKSLIGIPDVGGIRANK
jgi:hypothetical protein